MSMPEYYIYEEGDKKCPHDWGGVYLGEDQNGSRWGQECSKCGRRREEIIPGYNAPELQSESG